MESIKVYIEHSLHQGPTPNFIKLITGIDPKRSGRLAIIGKPLEPSIHDLDVGSIVLEGYWAENHSLADIFIVAKGASDGNAPGRNNLKLVDGPFVWPTDVETIVKIIKKLLDKKENYGRFNKMERFTDMELKEELEQRGFQVKKEK